jgi:hypothetical protein
MQKMMRDTKQYDQQQAVTAEDRKQKAIDKRNTQMYLDEMKNLNPDDPDYQKKALKIAVKYEKDPTKVIEYMSKVKPQSRATPEMLDAIRKQYADSPYLASILYEATSNPDKYAGLVASTAAGIEKQAPALAEKRSEFGQSLGEKQNEFGQRMKSEQEKQSDLNDYRNHMIDLGKQRLDKMQGIDQSDAAVLSAAISAGMVDPYHINSRNAAVLAKAYQTNPTQNLNDLAAQAQYERNTGTSAQKALLSNMYPLIEKVRDAGSALGNSNVQFVNGIKNWMAEKSGDPTIVEFDNLRDETIMEMQKALTGAGVASDTRYTRAIGNMKSAQSVAQLNAALDAMKVVTDSRLKAITAGPNPNAAKQPVAQPTAQPVAQPSATVTPKGTVKVFDIGGGHQMKMKKLNDGPDNVQGNWDQSN